MGETNSLQIHYYSGVKNMSIVKKLCIYNHKWFNTKTVSDHFATIEKNVGFPEKITPAKFGFQQT